MNKDTLENMATSAFDNMTKARAALFTAAEITIMEKYLLEEQRAAATTGGVFDGKNAEIREAQAKQHLEGNFAKLEQAEKQERAAKHLFDRASIEVDTVKTLLRIAELP